MIHHSLRIAAIALIVLVTSGAAAVPNIDRVIETQLEEVAARPGDPAVHNDLGNLLVLADRFDDAENAYRKAKDLSPADESSRFNLGLLLQQQERYKEAFDELSSLIEIAPDHAWAHYQLGMLEASRDNRSNALEFYARSFALDPTLTFERNNPHIIDNDLATEALLRSSQFRRSAASAIPRSYGEGARLREVMLAEAAAQVALEMEALAATEEKKTAKAKEGRTTGSGSTLSSSDDPPLPGDSRSGASFGEGEEEGVDGEDPRVIRNEDLIGIPAVGQASGGSSSERSATPRPVGQARSTSGVDEQSRRDAIRERLRGRTGSNSAGETPLATPGRAVTGTPETPTPTPTPRYRPSRRSSASLDLELLEEDPGAARGAA